VGQLCALASVAAPKAAANATDFTNRFIKVPSGLNKEQQENDTNGDIFQDLYKTYPSKNPSWGIRPNEFLKKKHT
jgi:hypothetical protein